MHSLVLDPLILSKSSSGVESSSVQSIARWVEIVVVRHGQEGEEEEAEDERGLWRGGGGGWQGRPSRSRSRRQALSSLRLGVFLVVVDRHSPHGVRGGTLQEGEVLASEQGE